MRISHPCPSCGTDLRRRRARRELGTAIVTCPGCGRVAARRIDRVAARRRAATALAKSVAALVLQLGALALFAVLVLRLCDPYAHDLLSARVPVAGQLLATGVVAVALGAWLAAAFAHWPSRTAVWLAFAAVVTAWLAVEYVLVPLIGIAARGLDLPVGGPPLRLDLVVAGVVALAAIMVVATAGIPIGAALRAGAAARRGRAWRARRRRLRERSLR